MGFKIEFLFLGLAASHGVVLQVHDPVGSSVVHLAIVEQLVLLQDTVAFLP